MGLPLGPPLHLSWEYTILEGGWFSLPLKGLGSGILRFGGRVPSLSLISCVTLGKFASLSSSFPYVQEKIIGIWRPRRMAEVKD